METLSPEIVELLNRHFRFKKCTVVVSVEERNYKLKCEKNKVQVEAGSAVASATKKKVRLIFTAVALLVLLGMMAYSYSQVGYLPSNTIIEMTIVVLVVALGAYGIASWGYDFLHQGAKKQIEQDFNNVDISHFVGIVPQKYQVESWEECQVEFEKKTFLLSSSQGKLSIVQEAPSYLFIVSLLVSILFVAFLKPELLNTRRALGFVAILPALVLHSLLVALYRSFGKSTKSKFITKIKAQIQGVSIDIE